MCPRSIFGALLVGMSNIVPGMSGDHPASIPEAGGRPGAPQRPPERIIYFFPKIGRCSALRAPTSESGPHTRDVYFKNFRCAAPILEAPNTRKTIHNIGLGISQKVVNINHFFLQEQKLTTFL